MNIGNENKLGNDSCYPRKSSLFFLTVIKKINPGIVFYGDRVKKLVKHFNFWFVWCVTIVPWKSEGVYIQKIFLPIFF